MSRGSVLSTFALLVACAAPARGATPEDAALAEQLFREAKELMADGQYARACPKLAESYRIDPGGGTLLSLALCHEAEGRTASAWADFVEALGIAKRDGRPDREEIARAHADALLPRLARLRVRVSAETSGIQVRRDGVVLGSPAWGVPAPVDPGEHVVEASAPGHAPFRAVISVNDEGRIVDVEVPPLAAIDVPRAAPAPAMRNRALTWAAIGAGGAAVASITVAAFLAIDAKQKQHDADARCPATACTDPGAVSAAHDAGVRADAATVALVLGASLAATAVTLWLLGRPPTAPTALRF